MEYVRLGLTDLQVSRVGFGCAAIGGHDYGKVDDQDSIAAVQKALDLGVNFFDTADVYGLGHAEELLGQALGSRRHDVIVATKFGIEWGQQGKTKRNLSARRVLEALDESLRRLRLDCITLYQIHWYDGRTPIAETMEALNKCQESGKIRFIGCCNFSLSLTEEAQKYGRLESLQLPYSLAERGSEPVIDEGHRNYQMAALCYNPLAQGLFTGKYGRDTKFQGTDLRARSSLFQGDSLAINLALVEKLKKVASLNGRTPAQVAIRWLLENENVTSAIVGIKTPFQIEENAGAVGWNLSRNDREFLSAANLPSTGPDSTT